MSSSFRSSAAAVAATLAIATAPETLAQEQSWLFEITPYLWAAGIDGDVNVGAQKVSIKRDFKDLVDALDIGGGLMAGAGYNHFGIVTQLDYWSLDSDNLDNSPANARLETDIFMAMLALGYRFGTDRAGRHFDVLLGARNLSMDNTLTLGPLGRFERDKDFLDPIIMVRPSFPLGKRWRFNPTMSFGGGGDSEKLYELQPNLTFQISEHVHLRFGYRLLHYETESDNGRTQWDGELEGFGLGIGGVFGGHPGRQMRAAARPVPTPATAPETTVAPPVPAPVAPPPPTDTDGDGVTDNIDKCPNTARGEKVDPVGCAYNVRLNVLFATNSAELTNDSLPELDRIVEALNSTPHLSAIVEGHTDSTGAAEHNQRLSERRAGAVVDYLASHGINRNRLQPQGFGASRPVASNATAEGRAQNRRVVLRRPDAD
jgi:outer membrane protein OmpA-like peptidoglycan-associated protein